MDPLFDRDNLIPVQVVWEGIKPFIKQVSLPVSSPNDRTVSTSTVRTIFSYSAPAVPFSPTITAQWFDAGLIVEEIEYQTGPLTRATAFMVRPKENIKTLLPGLLLFHCHSGVFRWGKEKVLARPEDPEELKNFRRITYEGRSLAHDFAHKGFLVMVPDAFYFGPRAIGREGIDAPPGEIDQYRKNSEHLVAKILLLSGHSWPALTSWEDRRALDYLCTRPEVDQDHIGCAGLSLGGFRSILLAAQDRRILSAVTAGWLTTTEDLVTEKIKNHSWMVLPGGLFPDSDFPMVAANAYPAALLALLFTRDHLFTLNGMKAASEILASYYRQCGREELCCIKFFDSDHRMTGKIQDQAIQWTERFLFQDKIS